MPTRFAILGAGAWGTATALVLAQNPDHRVVLWSARPDNAAELQLRRENVRLLPGVPIPDAIQLTADPGVAVEGVDLIVSAIPTVHLRSALSSLAVFIPSGVPILSLSKGIEVQTFLRPTEILRQLLGRVRVTVGHGLEHHFHVAAQALGGAQAMSRRIGVERQASVKRHQFVHVRRGAKLVEPPHEAVAVTRRGQQQPHPPRLVECP